MWVENNEKKMRKWKSKICWGFYQDLEKVWVNFR